MLATGLTIGEVLADDDAWSVARGCAEEAVAVAKAKGVTLDVGDPIAHVRGSAARSRARSRRCCSTSRPAAAARSMPSTASIPRLGKPLGVPTPVNDTVVGLVRARERALLPRVSAPRATVG